MKIEEEKKKENVTRHNTWKGHQDASVAALEARFRSPDNATYCLNPTGTVHMLLLLFLNLFIY
jgi:hypothetical protein